MKYMKYERHWVMWRISPAYRRRLEKDWTARFNAFWLAAADSRLSRTEVGRAALQRKVEGASDDPHRG